jgi:EAL and modified HD-GYP domain-containing signal transduction protein
MFSLLDAMMDSPLDELLNSLPLADEIVEALLHSSGPYARILQNAIAYEQGDWSAIDCPELSNAQLTDLFIEAVTWADSTIGYISREAA